jgi:hypothetical protein
VRLCKGYDDQPQKFPGEKYYNTADRDAWNFSNTDFLQFLICHKQNESVYAALLAVTTSRIQNNNFG